MSRTAIILLKDGDQVALIQHRREGKPYFLFPGDEVEAGEMPEEAAIRAASDNLGLAVHIDQLVAEVTAQDDVQYYYLGEILAGELDEDENEFFQLRSENTPVWMPVSRLLQEAVSPRALCEILVDALHFGWPEEVLNLHNDEP